MKTAWTLLFSLVLHFHAAASFAQPAADETATDSEVTSPEAATEDRAPAEDDAAEPAADEPAAEESVDRSVVEEEPNADEKEAEEAGEAITEEPPSDEPADDPLSLLDPVDDPDNPGMADLDRAMELRITAGSLKDLNEVVDLLDAALEKGLDVENTEFTEQVLVSTLLQRGTSLASAVLRQQPKNINQERQLLQLRLFALTDLQRAVSLDTQQHEAWLLLGRLHSLNGGNKSEARRALNKVIRYAERAAEDPELDALEPAALAQAFALRGASQKDPELRLADLSRAIELEPAKAEFRLIRARHYQAEKDLDRCLEDLDQAIELQPDNPASHELRALALLMQQRFDEALESFNRVSEIAPEAIKPYQYRGEVFRQMGRLDEAVAQLDRAIDLQPTNLASRLVRCELLLALAASIEEPEDTADLEDALTDEGEVPPQPSGDSVRRQAEARGHRVRALEDVEQFLQLQSGDLRGHLLRARALDSLGRVEEAVAVLEKIAAAQPENPELQFQLAAYYIDQKEQRKAAERLTRVLELDPQNGLALRLRGDMRLVLGEHAGAVDDFAAALDAGTTDSGMLNNYAWTLATSPYPNVRNGARAVELALEACDATEYQRPHILSTLAASYAEAGDFEKAIEWANKAVELASQTGEAADYDGQLEAELAAYQQQKPWRELQQESGTTAGAEGEVLTDLGPATSEADASEEASQEAGGEASDNSEATPVEEDPPLEESTLDDESEGSLDF